MIRLRKDAGTLLQKGKGNTRKTGDTTRGYKPESTGKIRLTKKISTQDKS